MYRAGHTAKLAVSRLRSRAPTVSTNLAASSRLVKSPVCVHKGCRAYTTEASSPDEAQPGSTQARTATGEVLDGSTTDPGQKFSTDVILFIRKCREARKTKSDLVKKIEESLFVLACYDELERVHGREWETAFAQLKAGPDKQELVAKARRKYWEREEDSTIRTTRMMSAIHSRQSLFSTKDSGPRVSKQLGSQNHVSRKTRR